MKQKIERNFKFWFLATQKEVLIATTIGIIYNWFFNSMMDSEIDFLYAFTLMCPFIMPMSFINMYISTVVGFGSGRKEAVYGLQIANFSFLVEMLIITVIYESLMGNNLDILPLIIAGCILGVGVSQLLGSLVIKFGHKAMVICLIVVVAVCFVIGFTHGLSMLPAVDPFVKLIEKYPFSGILGTIGICVYAVSIVVLINTIKKYEVRYA